MDVDRFGWVWVLRTHTCTTLSPGFLLGWGWDMFPLKSLLPPPTPPTLACYDFASPLKQFSDIVHSHTHTHTHTPHTHTHTYAQTHHTHVHHTHHTHTRTHTYTLGLVKCWGTVMVCPRSIMAQWEAKLNQMVGQWVLQVKVYHGFCRTKHASV